MSRVIQASVTGLVIVLFLFSVGERQTHAGLINGGFESGSLAPWQATSDFEFRIAGRRWIPINQPSTWGVGGRSRLEPSGLPPLLFPVEGSLLASNQDGNGTGTNSLDPNHTVENRGGQTLTQSFQATAGQELSFSYFVVFDQVGSGADPQNYSIAETYGRLTGPGSVTTTLFEHRLESAIGVGRLNGFVDWTTVRHTIAQSGNYSLDFRTQFYNLTFGDPDGASSTNEIFRLGLDDVRLQAGPANNAVPEPSTLSMISLALAAVALLRGPAALQAAARRSRQRWRYRQVSAP